MRSPDCLQELTKSRLRLLRSSADEAVRTVQKTTNANRSRPRDVPPARQGGQALILATPEACVTMIRQPCAAGTSASQHFVSFKWHKMSSNEDKDQSQTGTSPQGSEFKAYSTLAAAQSRKKVG
jgi:hypothetical protein